VIVVRHAEAAGPTSSPADDPPLSDAGRARAAELARVLRDAKVDRVYTTSRVRNRMTSAPLGAPTVVVDDVAATVAAVRGEPAGATVVVVGHSNTVPRIVAGLTGAAVAGEAPYDAMWIVSLGADGAASAVRLHYGAPVPSR
jgi:broad specificity phosphatase PhoE